LIRFSDSIAGSVSFPFPMEPWSESGPMWEINGREAFERRRTGCHCDSPKVVLGFPLGNPPTEKL
jgi:hypothetical protein